MASQVYRKTLEEVLTPERPVVIARVVKSEVEILPNLLRVRVEVQDVEPIYLDAPATTIWHHSFSTQLQRKSKDGSVVRVSPVREGSGLEQNLQAGVQYIFVLEPDGNLVRAEPLSRESEFRALLKQL